MKEGFRLLLGIMAFLTCKVLNIKVFFRRCGGTIKNVWMPKDIIKIDLLNDYYLKNYKLKLPRDPICSLRKCPFPGSTSYSPRKCSRVAGVTCTRLKMIKKIFMSLFVCLFVCLFVTEEIPITVSQRAPDKEAWSSPYHYCS